MSIDIGISANDREEIAQGLARLLADSYTLYLKTHNYHWNVTGPLFNTLHTMFEEQYTELALAVDQIAERIRALGHPAPGSYTGLYLREILESATPAPAPPPSDAGSTGRARGAKAGGKRTERKRGNKATKKAARSRKKATAKKKLARRRAS